MHRTANKGGPGSILLPLEKYVISITIVKVLPGGLLAKKHLHFSDLSVRWSSPCSGRRIPQPAATPTGPTAQLGHSNHTSRTSHRPHRYPRSLLAILYPIKAASSSVSLAAVLCLPLYTRGLAVEAGKQFLSADRWLLLPTKMISLTSDVANAKTCNRISYHRFRWRVFALQVLMCPFTSECPFDFPSSD